MIYEDADSMYRADREIKDRFTAGGLHVMKMIPAVIKMTNECFPPLDEPHPIYTSSKLSHKSQFTTSFLDIKCSL